MLEIWTIYDSPSDLPGRFVARKWLLDRPTETILQDLTLVGLRAQLPAGLTKFPRNDRDDPNIVETWF